jgi:hypothetical protein
MFADPGLRDDEAYSPVQATRRIPQQRENAFPKIQAIRWSVDHESTDVAAVGIDIHIAAPFVPVVDHPEIGFANRGMRSEGGLDQGKGKVACSPCLKQLNETSKLILPHQRSR